MEKSYKIQQTKSGMAMLAVIVSLIWLVALPLPGHAAQTVVKNVIVLMADGCGVNHTTLTRWFKGSPLAIDETACGLIRTFGADSIISDSAPAATAFGTGHKTSNKFVGILPERTTIPGAKPIPDALRFKPVASVLEGARFIGKGTGLVATANIQHASPAGYSAHWPDRSNYHEIALQQVHQNIDVVFGGGMQYLLPGQEGGTRTDGENLVRILKSRGYAVVETREDMKAFKGEKIWGLFAKDDMAYDFDRTYLAQKEPSLAEMTGKAIEILSRKEKGFFLFVEGSKVDWSSHANDPMGVVGDLLAFDDAAGVALDYAKREGNTLVLIFSDHDNGGMSIGNRNTNRSYSSTSYEALVAPLKKARLTGEGVEKMIKANRSEASIRHIVEQYYGIGDLSAEEVTKIRNAGEGLMNYALGPIFSSRSIIGWTTHGHNGADVPLYAYGPGRPGGIIDNTDLAYIAAGALGVDLDRVDGRLYAEVQDLFKGLDLQYRVDSADPAKPVLVVEKGAKRAIMPLSRNILKVDNNVYELQSLVILAPKTGKVYAPVQIVDLLKASGF